MSNMNNNIIYLLTKEEVSFLAGAMGIKQLFGIFVLEDEPEEAKLYGYCTLDGEIIIPPKFFDAEHLRGVDYDKFYNALGEEIVYSSLGLNCFIML